jgi:glycosyltransferase involved in cell wall biosynthesis
MKRRIIINATNLGKYIDGIGVYVLNILQELAEVDSDRHCIIYVNRACIDHIKDIRFPERCELRWVSGFVSPDHGFNGHFLRLLYSNYLGIKHWRSVIFIASQLEAILFRRNQIITIHDIIPLLFGNLHKKQYYYFKYILKLVLRRTRWVITPSYHTKELLEERYGISESKIHVIHNGVRTSAPSRAQESSERDDGNFILFSGRIVPMKNLAGVLRAFSLIKDKVPHKVVVIGHGRRKRWMHAASKLLDKYAVDPGRVEFKGYVSQEEKESLLSRASVLVFPSLYEGFGLPPLEGMAHGCPVVVSDVSSLPEVCADAGEYVDPTDDKSIAAGMYRLLTDHELRKKLVAKGLIRAQQFRWKDSAHKHFRLFDEALLVERGFMDFHTLQWRLLALGQTHPVLGFVLSSLLRHHHIR